MACFAGRCVEGASTIRPSGGYVIVRAMVLCEGLRMSMEAAATTLDFHGPLYVALHRATELSIVIGCLE